MFSRALLTTRQMTANATIPLPAVAQAAVHEGEGEQNGEVQHGERRGSILDPDQLLDGEKHDQKPK